MIAQFNKSAIKDNNKGNLRVDGEQSADLAVVDGERAQRLLLSEPRLRRRLRHSQVNTINYLL